MLPMKNAPTKGALLLEALALLFFFSCAFAVMVKSQHIQSYSIKRAKETQDTLDAFAAAKTLLSAKLESTKPEETAHVHVFEVPTIPGKIHAHCQSSQLRPDAPISEATYRYFRCVLTRDSERNSHPPVFTKHVVDLWIQKE